MAEKLKRGQPQPEGEPEPQPGVRRLIIEQDNGRVRYLEGEAAEKHLKQINDALGFMQVTRRYMLPEDFLQSPWQEIDVSEAPKLFQQEPKPTPKQGE